MTSRASLLTAEMAQDDLAYEGEDKYSSGVEKCMEALADGRTACAHVLTEAECRAEFEAWHKTRPHAEHFSYVHYDWGYQDSRVRNDWLVWLASRCAAGLVAKK